MATDMSKVSSTELRIELLKRSGRGYLDDEIPETCIVVNGEVVYESDNIITTGKIKEFVEQLKK